MTAEELETVFSLLLSAGTFKTKSFWYGEADGAFAFYNGGEEAETAVVEITDPRFRVVHGNPDGAAAAGELQVEIPPKTLAVLLSEDGTARGVEKDGILYTVPKEGGTVRCESGTVAAQYSSYGGIPELVRVYKNGDTVLDGEGEIRFFHWNSTMQPQ